MSPKTVREYNRYKGLLVSQAEYDKESFNDWLQRNNNNVARAFLKKYIQWVLDNAGAMDISKSERSFLRRYKIPRIKGRKRKRVQVVYKSEEIGRLIKAMPTERLKLMTLLTFQLGLRKAELLGLRFSQLRINERRVVIEGKGNKQRIVPIPGYTLERLRSWLRKEIVAGRVLTKNSRLFGINEKDWRMHLKKYSIRAGLEKQGRWAHPHSLRRSSGTFLYDKGIKLKELQDFLGHTSINTTQLYVTLDKEKTQRKISRVFEDG